MAKKSPGQETDLGNRGRLKVLNDTKLVLNYLESKHCPVLKTQFGIIQTLQTSVQRCVLPVSFPVDLLPGAPRLARPPRPGPCLDFGFQYALIRNNHSEILGESIGPCLVQIHRGGPDVVQLLF